MDLKQVQAAIKQIALEKGLEPEEIMNTLNTALAAAYRKDFGNKNQSIHFELDTDTGSMVVQDIKTVVDFEPEVVEAIKENGLDKKYVHGYNLEEEVEEEREGETRVRQKSEEELERELEELSEDVIRYNPKTDILLEEAQKIKKKYKVGDTVITELEVPTEFGRMAAQTAKQVIIQKLREAERGKIYDEYKDREGEMINAFIQRREGRNVLVDLGKATGIMPADHQVRSENYNVGDRMKFYIAEVSQTIKGPQIVVSRSHPQLIARLFEQEIPEIESGAIDIMGIAREAGFRAKVSVRSNDESIDPIGSCVGQRGARIQTIIAELNGEKIDIIEYSEEPEKYIANALSPAKVFSVEVNKEPTEALEGEATAMVPEDQLSLAIGREGQNVRLAAKLTLWRINILKEGAKESVAFEEVVEGAVDAESIEEAHEEAAPESVDEENELAEVKDQEDIDEESTEEEKMTDQDPGEAEVVDEPSEAEEEIVGEQPEIEEKK